MPISNLMVINIGNPTLFLFHMTSKHISYSRQTIDDSDIQAVTEVLKSDFLSQGPKIREFETALRDYLNVKHAIVCSNGTSALHLSYLASELEGAMVFTTPITFAATSNMLHAVGAKIRFVDVDPVTGIMDTDALKEALEAESSSSKKAIVPVSLQGIAADLPVIYELAKKYRATVIEDAAHSFGGTYICERKTCKSASCVHTDLATLSFHPLKTITCGEGGAVITNNDKLAERVRLFLNHGLQSQPNTYVRKQKVWGYNDRMSELQAALGLSQLKRIDTFVEKRRAIARSYLECLSKEPYASHLTCVPYHEGSSYHLFVVHFKDRKKRDFAYRKLKENGVETGIHYLPLYEYQGYRELLGNLSLPGADTYARGCLSLPIYPNLSRDEQAYVLDKLAAVCQNL